MAKCAKCNRTKGKRECHLMGGWVCSLCCGQTRKEETCNGCKHYKSASSQRRYSSIPRYSTQDMEFDLELQSSANSIEATLVLWDQHHQRRLRDSSVLRLLEILLDRYHFSDTNLDISEEILEEGVSMVAMSISQDLSDVSDEEIVKILAVIYFVASRRSRGNREYLDFIHHYIGMRAGPGIRILPNFEAI